jgi:uncharacterized protein (DUF488 family)
MVAGTDLLTVGHGTLSADALARLLGDAGVTLVVDVRSHPGSRRHPHFAREPMGDWLTAGGTGYRWEGRLGGRRRPVPDSPNAALRNRAFRGYADHMATADFAEALAAVLDDASLARVAVLCAESLWWRCHRRLLADAAVLVGGARVHHLFHDGRLTPHALTGEARLGGGHVVYEGPAASSSTSP